MIFIDPKGDNPFQKQFNSQNNLKSQNPNSKKSTLPSYWITGSPASGKILINGTFDPFREALERDERRESEIKKINNPKTSAIEIFEIASTSRFPENVKKAINHNNFNMEKYLEEFCDN